MKVNNVFNNGRSELSYLAAYWMCHNILLVVLYLQVCSTSAKVLYTNEFALRVVDGYRSASELASQYGFMNRGQIGSLKDYYLFEHHNLHKRSLESSSEHHELLSSHPAVLWVEQQHVKKRVKRATFEDKYSYTEYPDPLYQDQWFLHGGGEGGYDMNVLPAWAEGYTGKGVVVTILDDGVQTNHPDLAQNYDKLASLDINGRDNDPMPQDNGDNNHGTRCAGEVAAVAFNEFCGIGVAYNASIGGIRMLDGSVTDTTEATALSHNPNHVHIYSASWGPEDDGKTVDGPGPLAKLAFTNGIKKGRSGLGSIFVWASGNGGRYGDSCNCDGYTNSIYTISVSSATQGGKMPWYLEQCSSTMATTYSSGTASLDKSIVTVDMDNTYLRDLAQNREADPESLCTKSHTGTSASAPIAAGICALALEANPNLTWRDMQYLVLMTSRPEPLHVESGWEKNGVGRSVNSKFGYGLMDAAAMVKLARKWHTVPEQHICKTEPQFSEKNIPVSKGAHLEVSMNATKCQNAPNNVNHLEHVQVWVTLRFKPRGNLKILLISPAGTPSNVLLPRPHDIQDESFNDWPFMSVHFWGENPEGVWKLVIINSGVSMSSQPGKLIQWSLVFYGTSTLPITFDQEKRTEHRSPQSSTYSIRYDHAAMKTESLLNKCSQDQKFYSKTEEFEGCLETCPDGYYADTKDFVCHSCDKSCRLCYGPSYDNCLSCPKKLYLSKTLCIQTCPDGYYADSNKQQCLPCAFGCTTCSHSRDMCQSCKNNFILYEKQCLPSCPSSTYLYKSMCKKCDATCASCNGGSDTNCIECPSGTANFDGTCVSSCPENYYINKDNICIKCPPTCKTCDDGICLSCHTGWQLQHDKCLFLSDDRNGCNGNSPENCMKCSKHCALCIGPEEQNCVRCKKGFYWNGSACVKSCPSNTYHKDNICYNCAPNCLKCDSYNSCTLCGKELVLHDGNCLTKCPTGFYSDLHHHCQPCHSSCTYCTGGTDHDCLSCHRSYFLLNNTCLPTCQPSYFAHVESTECIPCYYHCATCSGFGPFECKSCQRSSSFVYGLCVPCLDDEYFDKSSKRCIRCHNKCGRCSGPSEYNCLSCQAPLRLDEATHTCLECCTSKKTKSECCSCSKELDICINSGEHVRSIKTSQFDSSDAEEILPMGHVLPVVFGVCAIAVVLFVVLFGALEARSKGWCQLFSFRRRYKRVPNQSSPQFDRDLETAALTQDDDLDEDDIYEKA